MGNCTQSIAVLPDEQSLHELAKWVYVQSTEPEPWNYENEGYETNRSIAWGLNDNGHHSLYCTHKNSAPREYVAKVESLGGTLLFRDIDNDGGKHVSTLAGKFSYNAFSVRHGMAPVPMKQVLAWIVNSVPGKAFNEWTLRAIAQAIANRAVSYFSMPVKSAMELCEENSYGRFQQIDTPEGELMEGIEPPKLVLVTPEMAIEKDLFGKWDEQEDLTENGTERGPFTGMRIDTGN